MKQPVLVNAMQMAVAHPKRFYLPDTSQVRRAYLVKVCDNRERFWVFLKKRIGNILVGIVANDLLESDLKPGDTIQFHIANIYDVEKPTKEQVRRFNAEFPTNENERR